MGYAGGYGCMGSVGGYGCAGCAGAVTMPPATAPATTTPKEPGVMPGKDTKPPGEDKGQAAAPATIVVSLPATARLTIDGNPTTSSSGLRVFASPSLQPGREYYYTLRAEVVRNGQTVAQTQRVAVRAGEETRVTLALPAAQAVASR
jgi:uncharacterized protein (TIGR03000 family)